MSARKILIVSLFLFLFLGTAGAQVTAIKAGYLVDPETGRATPDQIILIEQEESRKSGEMFRFLPVQT